TGSLWTTTCHGTSSSASSRVSVSVTGASTVDVFSSCTVLTALIKNVITLCWQFKEQPLPEFFVERSPFFLHRPDLDRHSRANVAGRARRRSEARARGSFRIGGHFGWPFPR